MDHGRSLLAAEELLDFSIFQVQPWLDVPDPNSSVVTIAADADAEAARHHAEDLAACL